MTNYTGRTHIEAIRRELTRLEFGLMNDDILNPNDVAIQAHRHLGNIVAQCDAITILIEDKVHDRT